MRLKLFDKVPDSYTPDGQRKIITVFALFPTMMRNGEMIWLENYTMEYAYDEFSSNTIEFSNSRKRIKKT